ncbi:probable protein preY, mitochondrial [Coccomyxa sp. Obi]|nr:probable protein preY, mitochondrial [Coccomyxa sp. Obi]
MALARVLKAHTSPLVKCLYSTVRTESGFSRRASNHHNTNFDEGMLEYLACPLSKTPLRWDAETSSLICDELGVAYPVTDGMPNLRPADGHVIEAQDRQSSTSQQPWGDAEPTPQ